MRSSYTSLVRDPYAYADLFLEGDVFVHMPDENIGSYEDIGNNENTQHEEKECSESSANTLEQHSLEEESYYLTVLPTESANLANIEPICS